MSAYEKDYLNDAMNTLGEAFDCAERCGFRMQRFHRTFAASSVSREFGAGNPRYTVGMSGVELFAETCGRALSRAIDVDAIDEERSHETVEYWCGWILAYVQWKTGLEFSQISQSVSASTLMQMYEPYHEMHEDHAAEAILQLVESGCGKLRAVRKARGLTQAALAERSGVSLRAIQQYEQGSKDINRAQAGYVYRMARVLGCRMEDLLEPQCR